MQDVRLLAAVIAKNAVGSSWRKTVDSREWSRVSQQEKQHVQAHSLHSLLADPSDKVAVQLALLVANIARYAQHLCCAPLQQLSPTGPESACCTRTSCASAPCSLLCEAAQASSSRRLRLLPEGNSARADFLQHWMTVACDWTTAAAWQGVASLAVQCQLRRHASLAGCTLVHADSVVQV